MRFRVAISLLLSTFVLTPTSLAQLKPAAISKAPQDLFWWYDAQGELKFSLKRYRGHVMVFYCWRLTSAESIDWLKTLSSMEKKLKIRGVRFVGLCAEEKERYEKLSAEKGVEGFTGGDTFNFFGEAVRIWQLLFGAMSHPECVIVDPFGTIVWRGHPADRVEERILDVVAATNPVAGDPKALAARLRTCEKLLDEKEYAKAYTIARLVARSTDEENTDNSKARSLMEKLEGKASEWLKDAIKAESAGDKEKAAYIVAQISVRFEDEDQNRQKKQNAQNSGNSNENQPKEGVLRDVNNEIGRMYGDRKLKELIRKAMDNARGELMMEDGAEYEEATRFDLANHQYRSVLEKYKDAPVAKDAKAAIDRLRNDKKVRQQVDKARDADEARRWLDLGERFAKAELYDQAREHYERVIKEHSKTDFAKTAKERMDKLPKPKEDSAKAGELKDEGKTASTGGKKP